MNWTQWYIIMGLGEALILLQAFFAVVDGYFSEAQMHERGIPHKYSFLQHAGMWVCAFMITPLVASLASRYQFPYFSVWGASTLAVVATFWITLHIYVYAPAGRVAPDAHAHDGYVTMAGWIQVVYASLASWVIIMMYMGLATLVIPSVTVKAVSVTLVAWTVFGVMKITPRWAFTMTSVIQIIAEIIGIIAITYLRLR